MFPERVVFYKAKGKKTLETTHMFCDASTWTGENHFQSARIGRTPKDPELSAAKSVLDTPESESAAQAEPEAGEQNVPLRAQHTEALHSVTARDAQDIEVSQDPEAKPSTEVMQHQELTEQTREAAQSASRSPQECGKTEAGLHSIGGCIPDTQLSCEDDEGAPLTQTTVKAEVHVSPDGQGGPGKVQSAGEESDLQTGAEPEDGVCISEETCAGKTHQEVPVPDPPAALCTTEESELPLKTAQTREGITDAQSSVEEQAAEEKICCAAKAPTDVQLEQDTEVSITKATEEIASEAARETAEVCDDGQRSEEIPCCLAETQAALQDEEIKASNGGTPEEH